jgi:2-polyprenyl-3-methyl-5-hydroxy-6-metoxy-1,4-benzoquinol methylase
MNTPSTGSHQRCWVCDSTRNNPWKKRTMDRPLEPHDLCITDSRYGVTLALQRCEDCGFIFADDREVGELYQLYERLVDPGYESTQDSRRLQMQRLMDRVVPLCRSTGTWLDIGAGAGLLVAEARRRGFQAEGVEPSHSLVEAAARLHSLEIHQGLFPHPALKGRKFDVISLVDVIEHVSNPVELLRDCEAALAPNGTLLVVTPDVGSVVARCLKGRWWHFRLAHVGYFDRSCFEKSAARAGLKVTSKFRPCWYFPMGYLWKRVLSLVGLARPTTDAPSNQTDSGPVVPLNLMDSWAFLCRRTADKCD